LRFSTSSLSTIIADILNGGDGVEMIFDGL